MNCASFVQTKSITQITRCCALNPTRFSSYYNNINIYTHRLIIIEVEMYVTNISTQFSPNHDERGIILTSYITCEITCFSCQVQYLTFVFTINHSNTIACVCVFFFCCTQNLVRIKTENSGMEISHTIYPNDFKWSFFCHFDQI